MFRMSSEIFLLSDDSDDADSDDSGVVCSSYKLETYK